jgi:hypothetical protein
LEEDSESGEERGKGRKALPPPTLYFHEELDRLIKGFSELSPISALILSASGRRQIYYCILDRVLAKLELC